jgi:hypothetical protein
VLDRRRFVVSTLTGALGAWALSGRAWARGVAGLLRPPARGALPDRTVKRLEESPFVYVSPLRRDGSESTCHAEVWYAWLDGAVVMTTAHDRWKARSIRKGLERARLWVGDYGRWKGLLLNNEDFRQGPSFVARGEVFQDQGLLDRLLAAYEKKYPDEIGRWRERMREGHRKGTRVLIRYVPIAERPEG